MLRPRSGTLIALVLPLLVSLVIPTAPALAIEVIADGSFRSLEPPEWQRLRNQLQRRRQRLRNLVQDRHGALLRHVGLEPLLRDLLQRPVGAQRARARGHPRGRRHP